MQRSYKSLVNPPLPVPDPGALGTERSPGCHRVPPAAREQVQRSTTGTIHAHSLAGQCSNDVMRQDGAGMYGMDAGALQVDVLTGAHVPRGEYLRMRNAAMGRVHGDVARLVQRHLG